MANIPGQRQRPGNGDRIQETTSTGSMQEPISGGGFNESSVSSSNSSFGTRDEVIREETAARNLGYDSDDTSSTSSMASRAERRPDRGFTTTFAIAAIVLLGAFLVALYLGSRTADVATNPDTQTPVTENAPVTGTGTTTNDATGSTTAAPPAGGTATTGDTTTPPAATPPAATTGTGTDTTAPANP
jgi:hypothetical protein